MAAGEKKKLERAVRWISDQRLALPEAKLIDLVTEASRRFDLSPLDEAALFKILSEGE